jgi:hypothetical protein
MLIRWKKIFLKVQSCGRMQEASGKEKCTVLGIGLLAVQRAPFWLLSGFLTVPQLDEVDA